MKKSVMSSKSSCHALVLELLGVCCMNNKSVNTSSLLHLQYCVKYYIVLFAVLFAFFRFLVCISSL